MADVRALSIGYTTKLIPNWDKFAPPIKAPSNYGAEAAAKYIASKKEKAQDEARFDALTAQLDSVHAFIHNPDGTLTGVHNIPDLMLFLRVDGARAYALEPAVLTRMLMEYSIRTNGTLHRDDRWTVYHGLCGERVFGGNKVTFIDPVKTVTGYSDLPVMAMLERYCPRSGPAKDIHDTVQKLVTSQPPTQPAVLAAMYIAFFTTLIEG